MNRTVTMQQTKRAAAFNIRTITMTALLSASDALMGYCLHFHFISKTFAAAFIETSPIKNMRERFAFSEGQCYNGQ